MNLNDTSNYGCAVTFQSDRIHDFSLSEDNPSEKSHILTLKEGAEPYLGTRKS